MVAWDVAEMESAEMAADLVQRACLKERYRRPSGFGSHQCHQPPLILHADNGNAMRGATLESRLALWCRGQEGRACATSLRRAVYRPARSTDILLQEFISGGPNEGDLAMVCEASALARQEEASRQRPGGYRLLFPDPTIETVLAAALLGGEAAGRAEDGRRFVEFLLTPEAQSVLNRHGFRGPGGAGGSPSAQG